MATTNPSQIQQYLSGVDYPCSKTDLVTHARDEGADDSVLTTLKSLPVDHFDTPNEISEAIGKMN